MSHVRNINTGRTKPTPETWEPSITAYLRRLTAIGQPATTRTTRRQQLERLARAHPAITPDQITEDHIIDYLAGQRWATDTRRGHRNAIVGFYRWLHHTDRCAVDPTAHLPSLPAAKPSPRPAPERAVHAALAHAEPRTRLMVRLAAEGGLRRGEVAVVATDDVLDGIGGPILRVHGKGAKIRTIPISSDLAHDILRGPAGHTRGAPHTGYLFPGQIDGHLSPRRVGELIAAVLPEHWTAHPLRHRFATQAYRGTKNLRAVQELLGHESVATTEAYTAVDENEVRSAMLAAQLEQHQWPPASVA